MATDHPRGLSGNAAPPKVVGLGAPISVWIYFDVSEIPALVDAIDDELARYGASAQRDGRPARLQTGRDPSNWSNHIGELHRMLADVQRAAATTTRRFDVVWRTVMAHAIVHGAVRHAERRADRAAARRDPQAVTAADEALAAALQTRRDFDAVDNGGRDAVWL